MANTPQWKVFNAAKEYRASFKDPCEAACLVELLGNGATLRLGHSKIVWTEGKMFQPAHESYDYVAKVAWCAFDERNARVYDRIYGEGAAAKVRATPDGAAGSLAGRNT